jgi:2-polyprenyl-6-hydroxyphenyl methylase/3-demethylubiquinone-9 3-methyltransferase
MEGVLVNLMTTKVDANSESSVDEIALFESHSKDWWLDKGPFSVLHKMNACRLKFIKEVIQSLSSYDGSAQKPLNAMRFLDIGCGGGILCEPLSRMGVSVTGIDASATAIQVAKKHALINELDIDYRQDVIEKFQGENFDVVCALEIIEHVKNPEQFIKNCLRTLKKGGVFFISTLNKNLRSFLEAIIAAEYVLRWAPKGTHDWNNFFKPSDLLRIIELCGTRAYRINGMNYSPLKGSWYLSDKPKTSYIIAFIKNNQ